MSDLFKLMVLLIKNDNLTDEEFTRYWLRIHAPLVKKMPGVRKYVVNVVKKPLNREPDYHGVLELWFDNVESMKMAFASPEGRITQEDTYKFASSMTSLYIDEYDMPL